MKTKERLCTKIALSIFSLLVLCRTAGAQDARKGILSAADAGTCTANSTACSFLTIPSGSGGVTFTITSNASANTIQFEATGDTEPTGSHTWVALNVVPSNGTTAVTSTTSTGTWQANIAGFTQVRLRCSTFVGGTTTTYINLSTASARSNGGGGGSGGTSAFGPNYAVGGGTAQAQTVAPTVAVTNATLVAGYQICWLPVADNTGAGPTLAGSGTSTFSAKVITKYGTANLVAGDIIALGISCVVYDGTEFELQVPQTNVTNPAVQYGVPYYSASGTKPTLSGTVAGLTGQSLTATNASAPTFASPGVPGRTTASATDTILCDSATAILDRASTVEYTAAAVTVTVPDAGTSGCASNFVTVLIAGNGTTATVNRQTASTFTIYDGTSVTSAATTFTLTTGQYAVLSSPDNANWVARKVSGGGSGFPPCVTTTGTVNVMVATYSPAIVPATGTLICFKPNLANTTTTPTINVNGFGAKTLTRQISALNTTPADLLTTNYYYAVYDGTKFQLVNYSTQVALTSGNTSCIVQYNGGVSPATLTDANICLNGSGQWVFGGVGLVTGFGAFISGGSGSPPACAVGTGGAQCYKEGTAPTAAATVDDIWADSTAHAWKAHSNAGGAELMAVVAPSPIHVTAQTAAISTATLCSTSAGNCDQAGNYTVEWVFTQTGTACGTPNFAGVTFLLTWTDQNGTAHSAISLPMDDSSSLVATSGLFSFRTTNAAAWASGNFNISSNGSIIQYATGYTACSVGTGTYQLDAWVTRKE